MPQALMWLRGDFYRASELLRFSVQFEVMSVILSILTRDNSVTISISCLAAWLECLLYVCKHSTAEIASCLRRSFIASVIIAITPLENSQNKMGVLHAVT